MNDITRHPDDEMLFDLVDGALDAASDAQVRAHLERCSACAAFVDAARAGAPETRTAVVAMPESVSERLHLRLAEGWRERTDAIAASEARIDAAAVPAPVMPDDELVPLRPNSSSRRPAAGRRHRWSRRLVPALAFGVLATLAGTSVWIGDEPTSTRSTPDDSTQIEQDVDAEVGSTASLGAPGPASTTDTKAQDASASGRAADDVDGRTVPAPRESTAGELDVASPPIGYEALASGQLCFFTFNRLTAVLPDGHVPQLVQTGGPFGLMLVCD